MTTIAPTDGELASAARLGDRDAFGVLYERYFSQVYDFLARMTRDREMAGDLAQDTFVMAMQRLDQIDDPERFRPWLYTVARNTALNRLRRERRSIPSDPTPSDEAPGPLLTLVDADRFGDPEEAARAAEVADLVWEAAAGLDERTFTVLDLTLRHGLASAEIAEVMGVSRGNASVMVNRMKERAGDAIETHVFMRQSDCLDLDAIIGSADFPPVHPDLRRSVDRHVGVCEVCAERKRRVASPTQIMAAYAAVPPPDGLAEAVWGEIERRWDTEGPGAGGSRLWVRAGAVLGAFLLIATLGVAGAREVVELEEDALVLTALSTTTSSTSTTSTSSPSSTTSTTTTTSSTTLPETTSTAAAAPTTTAPRLPPPPPDTTTTVFNPPPVVQILMPGDGTTWTGFAIPMEAAVSDDSDTSFSMTWTSNQQTAPLGTADQPPYMIVGILDAGCPGVLDHVITATVVDSGGAVGSDTVTITVVC